MVTKYELSGDKAVIQYDLLYTKKLNRPHGNNIIW